MICAFSLTFNKPNPDLIQCAAETPAQYVVTFHDGYGTQCFTRHICAECLNRVRAENLWIVIARPLTEKD